MTCIVGYWVGNYVETHRTHITDNGLCHSPIFADPGSRSETQQFLRRGEPVSADRNSCLVWPQFEVRAGNSRPRRLPIVSRGNPPQDDFFIGNDVRISHNSGSIAPLEVVMHNLQETTVVSVVAE